MRIDMGKWNSATKSCYYADWSYNAQKVCKDVGVLPTYEDGKHIFSFFVRNKYAKNNRRSLLRLALTPDGNLEYFTYNGDSRLKPRWYIETAVEKLCLLLNAFCRNGFIKEGDYED